MRNVTFRQRLSYGFDNIMSKGTPALILALGIASFLMIFVISLVVWIIRSGSDDSNAAGEDFVGIFWRGLLRTLDSGTMGGDQGTPQYLGLMLLVTLGGIFIVSTLIGVLSTGIESKLDELRKGRSLVLEEGHTLILGWSDQVFIILRELAVANANQKNPRVVILADKDKVEMQDEVRAKVRDLGKTRVICRT